MKRLKKTLALALALILALAMSTAVFATENGETLTNATGSIVIQGAPTGHSYEAYQIFTGDLVVKKTSNDDGTTNTIKTLSNVKWGDGVSAITKNGVENSVEAGTDATSEAEAVKNITSTVDLTDYINSLTLQNPKKLTETNGEYKISNLTPGYYVVKDKDGSVDKIEGDEYTAYIVQVVGDVTTDAKTAQTTSKKKVKDINDSDGKGETNWQDSADYDIDDEVPFQLSATVTANYGAYTTYYLAFHDQEAEGLSFNEDSVVVKIDGSEVDKDLYKIVTATNGKGTLLEDETFEIVFENLKLTKAHAKSEITVEYTSTLTKKANIGSEGNKNTMYLQYSNNPNVTGDGSTTGTTPKDTVIVFTYEVEINKVDQDNNALKGATFALYKKDASVTSQKTGYKEFDGEFYKILDYVEIDNADTTVFTFRGIDDGDYILSETETPPGYNSISDIKFSVEAAHSESADEPALTSLTGNVTTGSITINATSDYKTLKTTVENKSGSVLPSTGGTGRVLLYVVGAILVVGVGVILVSKKRAQQ